MALAQESPGIDVPRRVQQHTGESYLSLSAGMYL